MLEILKFILSDVWYFIGTVALLVFGSDAIAKIIRAIRGTNQ
ncbi:MAG: hypothetical protein ACKVOU_07775 [Cytophagales bacterium]